jgi:hypothetical protein
MNNQDVKIVRVNEDQNSTSGMKIIEWNVSDPAESLYSVVTPIKMK